MNVFIFLSLQISNFKNLVTGRSWSACASADASARFYVYIIHNIIIIIIMILYGLKRIKPYSRAVYRASCSTTTFGVSHHCVKLYTQSQWRCARSRSFDLTRVVQPLLYYRRTAPATTALNYARVLANDPLSRF